MDIVGLIAGFTNVYVTKVRRPVWTGVYFFLLFGVWPTFGACELVADAAARCSCLPCAWMVGCCQMRLMLA